MSGIVGCLSLNAVCGVAQGSIHMACCVFSWTRASAARYANSIYFFLIFLLTYILNHCGPAAIIAHPEYTDVPCTLECYRFYIVYRMALGTLIYHAILAVSLIGISSPSQPRVVLQEGFWPVKAILWFASILGVSFIPRWLYDYLFIPALVMSIIFVLVQSVILVETAYEWAEALVDRAESSFWRIALILLTILLWAGHVASSVYMFIMFKSNLDRALIIGNGVAALIISALSIMPFIQEANPSAGIFQSTVLSAYALLQMVSGFLSDPNQPSSLPVTLQRVVPVVAAVLAIFLIVKSASTSAKSSQKLSGGDSDMSPEEGHYNYSIYHFVFMTACMFAAVVLTGWKYPTVDKTGTWGLIDTRLVFWSKVSIGWGVMLLYVWTLFAPVLLPGRDFS